MNRKFSHMFARAWCFQRASNCAIVLAVAALLTTVANGEELQLIHLECMRCEDQRDRNAPDEPLLKFFEHCRDNQGKTLWKSRRMKAGDVVDLTHVGPLEFHECCKLQLWDLDNDGSHDHLGTCHIREGDVRGGEGSFHFKKNGCHYKLVYEVRGDR